MRSLCGSLLLFALCAIGLVGCQKDEAILQFTVTHEERQPIHLRVAFLRQDKLMWFFRISGPETQVKEHLTAFEKFVKSVRFEGKDDPPISWTEPKDWKKDPPGGERYASFRIETKPKELEVTVTRLPAEEFDLMPNMHRWQKQINLPLTEQHEDLRPPLVTTEKLGERELTWVALTGLGVHTVSKAADPKAQDQKKLLAPLGMKDRPAAELPFNFELPKGWEMARPLDGITRARIVVEEKGRVADVTLTSLPGKAGGLGPNVNRWRNQVELKPLDDAEIGRTVKTLQVLGVQSHYVDLANPQGPAGKNGMLAVIVPLQDKSWFVKMIGPHDFVGERKTEFEAFVKSFKLEGR